jgi:hypothetical protein
MNIRKVSWPAAMTLAMLAAQERSGNQIFQIPQGWTRTEVPGGTLLSPSAEPKNQVVLLLAGHPLNAEFREMFDRDVKVMNGALRVVKSSEVQSRHTSAGVDFLEVGVELQGGFAARSERRYMAASVNGRYELLTFMAASPLLYQRYWPAVQQFVSTWSFANLNPPSEPGTSAPAGAAPAAPAAVSSIAPANRLDGVYGGYKFNYVNTLGAVQRTAVNDYFSFFPDGTVFWGFPQTGLAGFNMNRACQGRVELCGTYQVNGDRVTILLNRGTYRQDGSLSSGGLQIADRNYTLQGDPAKSAAHALEGDFMRADARPGEDLARHFIRFTRNGQFVDQGIVTTVVSSDISTGSPRFERAAGSGTYTIAPYTLILHYSDGYQRQLGVTIQPADMDKPALSQIFVNTYTLVRRN